MSNKQENILNDQINMKKEQLDLLEIKNIRIKKKD